MEYVSNDQYVDAVNRSMDLQNMYLGIFLAVLAIVLGFVGVLQWRLSSKQIETIKVDTRKSTIDEIIGLYSINKVPEILNDLHSQKKEYEDKFSDTKKLIKKVDRHLTLKNKRDFSFDIRLVIESPKKKIKSLHLLVVNYHSLLKKDKTILKRVIKLINQTVIPYLENMVKISDYSKSTITKIITTLNDVPINLKEQIPDYEEVLEKFSSYSDIKDRSQFSEDQEDTIES